MGTGGVRERALHFVRGRDSARPCGDGRAIAAPEGVAGPVRQNAGRQRAGRLIVGCSGWQYRWWKGNFYPDDLPTPRWLEYYARHFQSVEVNNTFYRLPPAATFEHWRDRTPEGFLVAVKASRYLTHLKRLKDARPSLTLLFSRVAALGSRTGPILFQLPPHLPRDLARLEAFVDDLAATTGVLEDAGCPARFVVEFRDRSWYVDGVFERCDRAGVAVCLHDMAGSAVTAPVVGPFVYIRFHGPDGRYHGSYAPHVIREWAARMRAWSVDGRDVFAYFNNDPGGAAVRDARALRVSVGQSIGAVA